MSSPAPARSGWRRSRAARRGPALSSATRPSSPCSAANVGGAGAVHARDAAAPGPAPAAHDIAWLDPPWGLGAGRAGARRASGREGWLKPGALVVVESAQGEAPDLPGLIDRRRYGRAALAFLRLPPASLAGPGTAEAPGGAGAAFAEC